MKTRNMNQLGFAVSPDGAFAFFDVPVVPNG